MSWLPHDVACKGSRILCHITRNLVRINVIDPFYIQGLLKPAASNWWDGVCLVGFSVRADVVRIEYIKVNI